MIITGWRRKKVYAAVNPYIGLLHTFTLIITVHIPAGGRMNTSTVFPGRGFFLLTTCIYALVRGNRKFLDATAAAQ